MLPILKMSISLYSPKLQNYPNYLALLCIYSNYTREISCSKPSLLMRYLKKAVCLFSFLLISNLVAPASLIISWFIFFVIHAIFSILLQYHISTASVYSQTCPFIFHYHALEMSLPSAISISINFFLSGPAAQHNSLVAIVRLTMLPQFNQTYSSPARRFSSLLRLTTARSFSTSSIKSVSLWSNW